MKVPRSLQAVFLFLVSFLSPAFGQTIASPSVNVPLAFEVNRGQTAAQVDYLPAVGKAPFF